MEGLLTVARQGAGAVVVAVHVDEPVALGHLRGGGANHVDATPGGVAEHVHAVLNRLAYRVQVLAQVVDAVVILHGELAVHLDQFVAGAQAVLHDE